MKKQISLLFYSLIALPNVLAHETEVSMLQKLPNPLFILGIGVIFCLAFLCFVLFKKNWKNQQKKILFWSFAVLVSTVTIYFLLYTLLVNFTSETNGPVHWHADFEIWVCGQRQTVPHSTGISGRDGTPLLHHHNDDRIHIEGTIINTEGVSLGNFFAAIGGALADSYIGIPQEDGTIQYWHNEDACPDGHAGTLSLYITRGNSVAMIPGIAEYVISPETNVPPGDQLKLVFN